MRERFSLFGAATAALLLTVATAATATTLRWANDSDAGPSEKLGTWNVGGYSNKRVDELIGQIQSEVDPKKRQAMISEAFRIHKEEFGHIPLHQQSLAWAARENVQVIQSSDGILRLRYVRVR